VVVILDFKDWIFESTKKYACVMAVFAHPKPFINWTEANVPQKDVYEEEGIEYEPHVTALYGLHTNDYQEVEKHIKGFKSFDVELGAVSKFDTHPDYDVLKLSVESKELKELNKLLKELPYTSKYDEYVPHCTLAYVKKGRCDELVGNKHFAGKKMRVNELTFSSDVRRKTKIGLK
jgi:2'-5' RNA ligase